MLRLSIIVPVYNVRDSLFRCVQSLISQDIPSDEYEIILINDGSTDDSVLIAQRLVSESVNVKLINQENRGLSGARNTGIENASGKYIWFIDSDDYIVKNCLNQMLNEVDKYDVDVFAFLLDVRHKDSRFSSDGSVQKFPLYKVMTGKFAMLNGFIPCSSCSYFFYRGFINKNALTFTIGITHQDVEFMTRVMSLANRVVFTNHKPYIYDYNPNSLSKSKTIEKRKKFLLDNVQVSYCIKEFACRQSDLNLRKHLNKRANSIVFGLFWSIMTDKCNHIFIDEAIALAKDKGLYPIKRPLLSWKSTVLSILFNQKWFLRNICR
jgi:glycosyltransferase involved in cell wall biosynthesis